MAFSCCKKFWASTVHYGSLTNEVKLFETTSFSPSSLGLTLATLLNFPISFYSTNDGQFLKIIYFFPSLSLITPCSFFLTTWTTKSWSFGLTPAGTAKRTEFFYKNLLVNSLRSLIFSFISIYLSSFKLNSTLDNWYSAK